MGIEHIFAVLARRWWLIAAIPAAAMGIAGVLTLGEPSRYAANATILIDIRGPLEIGSDGTPMPPGVGDTYVATQLSVIASHPVAKETVRRLSLENAVNWTDAYRATADDETGFLDWAASILLNDLTVSPQKGTRLVDIWYSGGDPEFVASVANAVAESYQEITRGLLTGPALETRESLSTQLESLRSELEKAQGNLSSFQQRTGIFATDERWDIETTRLNELSAQLLGAESAARVAEIRMSTMEQVLADGGTANSLPQVLSSPAIQSLKQSLDSKETELAQVSAQLGSQHPTRKTVEDQVRSLRTALANETQMIAEGLRAEFAIAKRNLEAAQAAETEQRSKVDRLRVERDALPALLQHVATASANYNRALEAYGQYEMQISISPTDVVIFNRARAPIKPSGPSLRRNLFLALILGGLFGVAVAFLWEYLNPRILTSSELKQFKNFPDPQEIPRATT